MACMKMTPSKKYPKMEDLKEKHIFIFGTFSPARLTSMDRIVRIIQKDGNKSEEVRRYDEVVWNAD